MSFIDKFLHTFLPTVASAGDFDEDDDYTPALPPDLLPPAQLGLRPSLPHSQAPYDDDDSDSDVGPQLLPAAYASQIEGKSGVEEFLERDERRWQLQEETSKTKKLRREEWMLVPPKSGDLLACLVSSHVALECRRCFRVYPYHVCWGRRPSPSHHKKRFFLPNRDAILTSLNRETDGQ
ncbi:hypothetical protein EV424DRAFT_1546116 [Suillus variegatus]|nr:hypothetical protein EV424DRAFT_1546116 [Suillus variegatus]